uniref:Uncharacterized protein n=1 Tax=Desulfacinum infernum TaxID=35837 RepID=A0A831ZXN1_9BACT
MSRRGWGVRTAAVLGGIFLWTGGFGTPGERWQPKTTFAEMVETKEAVIYRAQPEDPPGAQAQRREEERKEAASWEMLRRLTIEIERPTSQHGPSFPSRPEPKAFP